MMWLEMGDFVMNTVYTSSVTVAMQASVVFWWSKLGKFLDIDLLLALFNGFDEKWVSHVFARMVGMITDR